MTDHNDYGRFTSKYHSPKVVTNVQWDNLKADIAERMRIGISRRRHVNKEAQNLLDKITKYWRDKGFQPPVLWVENDGLNPELPSYIRSNMIGGMPQVKLHD